MNHKMNVEMIEQYRRYLIDGERSCRTIEKYLRDLEKFVQYLGDDMDLDKERVIKYKQILVQDYAAASTNSMLASINGFFKMMGWYDCVVKYVRQQREMFRESERELTREEYYSLINMAETKGKKRLSLLIQTICATGIRVSELQYITVEALNSGKASVVMKGKRRTVILPKQICRKLIRYIKENGIKKGAVFVTRGGKPVDRSNICRDMKKLCPDCGISVLKVFPHNLRHLFACSYYKMKKDITHLADLLGHANINTTRIYTLSSGEEEAKELELLGLVT